jgi:hypothetical protein
VKLAVLREALSRKPIACWFGRRSQDLGFYLAHAIIIVYFFHSFLPWDITSLESIPTTL